jgi:hypothetical protein
MSQNLTLDFVRLDRSKSYGTVCGDDGLGGCLEQNGYVFRGDGKLVPSPYTNENGGAVSIEVYGWLERTRPADQLTVITAIAAAGFSGIKRADLAVAVNMPLDTSNGQVDTLLSTHEIAERDDGTLSVFGVNPRFWG